MAKLFFVLSVVISAVILKNVDAVTEEEKKEMHSAIAPFIMECSEKHGANADEVMAIKKTKEFEGMDACLIECVLKKIDLLDDEGKFVPEKFVTHIKKFVKSEEVTTKIEEAAKKCLKVNDEEADDEKCERAKPLLICLMEQKDELGL